MTKYRCKLCVDYGDDNPFINEEFSKVGEHIVWDHAQNDINDWVSFYGNGIEIIKDEVQWSSSDD